MSIAPGDEKLTCLYKYRPLIGKNDAEIDKYTLKILEDGELFFSKPSVFNDPFDSNVDYVATATEIELRSYFKNKLPADQIDIVINKINNGTVDINTFAPNGSAEYADLLKIFCLTKNPNNILMWSHYSKNHTGICIGFKVHIFGNSLNLKIKPGFVRPLYQGIDNNLIPAIYVEYDDTKPSPYNIFKSTQDDFKPFCKRKSKLWSYEEELRLLLFDSILIKNPVCIEKVEIVEIIFGLRAPQNLEQKVIDIIKTYPGNGAHVKIYKETYVLNKYEVSKMPY